MAVYKRTWKRPDESKGACWYFHKTINGVRYRDRIPTARTKGQAEEAERQILSEIHAGAYGKPQGKIKMREFVEKHYQPWARVNKRSWRNSADPSRTGHHMRERISLHQSAYRYTVQGREESVQAVAQ